LLPVMQKGGREGDGEEGGRLVTAFPQTAGKT
jgi:hypothetical protein